MNLYKTLKLVKSGNMVAMKSLKENLKTPIIEAISETEDEVTFVYIGDENTSNVVFHSSATGFKYDDNRFDQVENTSVWVKSYVLPNDVEFIYWLSINDSLDNDGVKRQSNLTLDPCNKEKFIMKDDPEIPYGSDFIASFCKLSRCPDKIWTLPGKHTGTLDKINLKSDLLNNSRRVWVYIPKGVNISSANVVVILDGQYYVHQFNTPLVIDRLIEQKKINDTLVIYISSNKDRMTEMTFNDTFNQFVIEEVCKKMMNKYNLTRNKDKWSIVGHSLGGLAAAYLAIDKQTCFGKVLLQSAALYWKKDDQPQWIVDKMKTTKNASHYYMTYGKLEKGVSSSTSIEVCNEAFAEVLRKNKMSVKVEKFVSGHDYLNWGETLAFGLMALQF